MQPDPRIDSYIGKAAPFAQPILAHLRAVVRAACPDGEETMKWSSPSFVYRGKILAGMAAFKAHAAFVLWQREAAAGVDVDDTGGLGSLGRLTALADLPDDAALEDIIRHAMALIEQGKKPARKHPPRAPITMPEDFDRAMGEATAARLTYDGLPPSKRYDYLEWITEAKQAATREKRIAQAVLWLAEGKARHWKYEKC